MREIKFRLILDNKIVGYEKWYSGKAPRKDDVTEADSRWLFSADNKQWFPSTSYRYGLKRYPFTGLKDKNDKEIYEGDIVEFEDRGLRKGLIKYSNEGAGYWIDCVDGATTMGNPFLKEFEVIGNIYENPELITQQK